MTEMYYKAGAKNDRNAEIRAMSADGLSLEMIGKSHGITRQRVAQILKAGIPNKPKYVLIRELWEEGKCDLEIADILKLPRRKIRAFRHTQRLKRNEGNEKELLEKRILEMFPVWKKCQKIADALGMSRRKIVTCLLRHGIKVSKKEMRKK